MTSQRKTPEFKKMMTWRRKNGDGFTYVYGAIKDGSSVRPATQNTKRAARNDKRSTKAKEMAREMREQNHEIE